MPRLLVIAALVISLSQVGLVAGAGDGRFRVCLDPGHGGTDTGAVRGALIEKVLNLDVARRVEEGLGTTEYVVQLTRNDNDTTLGNSARAEICNAFGAQVVLSIHFNATTDPSVDYIWFFYGKPRKDRAFTEAMDEHYVLADPDPSVTTPLAHKAITNFANGTLLKSKAPATLAETLFMSNTLEQELLAATDGGSRRQQIADALVVGLRAWAGR